ncbi:IS1341-type transposase [Halorubrum sp. AJ67]|nr:IS1341-type transposase [Halorubrum sp. AJ67]
MSDDLDALGFAASKLWNVGRWTCIRIWDEIGHIPNHAELTRTSRITNAMMTYILSQVSESFKNSLKRSVGGTANDATEIRERTRPATANTTTNTHEVRSRSKPPASNSIPSTIASDSQKARTSRSIGPTSSSMNSTLDPTLTSLP